MQKIIIVDNEEKRANSLRDWLSSFKPAKKALEYDIKRYSTVKEESQTEGDNIENILFFLHVGTNQDDMPVAIDERYAKNNAICYSGGKEVRNRYKEHQIKTPYHYWYDEPIPTDRIVDHVKYNFSAFLNSYPEKPGILSDLLQKFNPLLEAKLELISWVVQKIELNEFKTDKDRLKNWSLLQIDDNRRGKRQLDDFVKNTLTAPDSTSFQKAFVVLRNYLFEE